LPRRRGGLGFSSSIGLNGVLEFICNREIYSTRARKIDNIIVQTIYYWNRYFMQFSKIGCYDTDVALRRNLQKNVTVNSGRYHALLQPCSEVIRHHSTTVASFLRGLDGQLGYFGLVCGKILHVIAWALCVHR